MTLTIKNARDVTDLDSHKLEFVAENRHDKTSHTVMVDYRVIDPPSGLVFFINSHSCVIMCQKTKYREDVDDRAVLRKRM